MKIKITEKEKEVEGVVKESKVTPFSNSAHIVMNKKHRGQFVDVVIPEKPFYSWLLSEEDKIEFIKVCKNNIPDDKTRIIYLEMIGRIESSRFYLDDLFKLLELIVTRHNILYNRIREIYCLD